MEFRAEVTYPADLQVVLAMLKDPEYQRERLRLAGMEAESIEVMSTDNGFASVVKITQNADDIRVPPMAKRFIPADGVRATITEFWDEEGDSGTIALDLAGLPIDFTATSRLRGAGESVKRLVEGTIQVRVPLIGKKIEAQAVQHVKDIVEAEEQAARAYLS
ncbi:MAG: DUF2505 domain-containing protein [Actinomycetaceae bacterium]|nr:DUF2505 domain-containing protein [Actinomycetaceae bacterium]